MALELQQHGHDVTVLAAGHFHAWALRLGIPFKAIGGDIDHRAVQARELAGRMSGRPPAVVATDFAGMLSDTLRPLYDELRDFAETVDVLVAGHLQPAAFMVHETTRVPLLSVRINDFGFGPSKPTLAGLTSLVNDVRRALGLTAVDSPFEGDPAVPYSTLFAMSRWFRQPEDDASAGRRVTGFFYLPEEWTVDEELVRFIESGAPPVVVTFGSMAHDDTARLTSTVVAAVRKAGKRVVLQRGWTGLGESASGDDVFTIGYVPYEWLFERACCVVHHGGIGPSSYTFRSGTPGVWVPHIWDQYLWADLAHRSGCAGPMLPFPNVTVDSLAASIEMVTSDDRYRRRAATIARLVQSEDGVGEARNWLEETVAHRPCRRAG